MSGVKFKASTTKPTVEVLDECIPSIVFTKIALTKMQIYVDTCTNEVGWLGIAHKDEQDIIIDDVLLFPQEVHATTTEITPEGLSIFGEDLLQQPNGMEIWNNIKVWGHSHANMGVSPSGQDDNQMHTFADNGHDWFVRIIANKKGDIKIDLYDYSQGIVYLNLKWYEEMSPAERVIIQKMESLKKKLEDMSNQLFTSLNTPIQEEIKVKVLPKKYPTVATSTRKENNYGNYDWDGYGWVTKRDNVIIGGFHGSEDEKVIRDSDDVYERFPDDEVLIKIGRCKAYADALTIIKSLDTFTHAECWIIYSTAQKIIAKAENKSIIYAEV